ncbi:MAG: multiheme c-type cytochrome [Sulfurimonas sp.]
MMKFFLLALLTTTILFGAKVVDVDEKYQDSQKCKVCHLRIVDEWSNSWHSKSHFANDEYFRQSMKYVSKKTRKSLNSVKVQCATCHNPRISVTSTGEDYEIAAIMGLDKGSKVDKAVNSKSISEGVNCVVCHNIDKIHDEYNDKKRGINRVEWTPSGTMTGPFKDAVSPYHKTIHHDFMDKTPNKMCFVCHANDRSVKGLVFTNMQKEYKGSKTCVECHMGPKRKDVASTYKMHGNKAKIRHVRNHSFAGAHITSMWKDALRLKLSKKGKNILVTISNPQPHNLPSGFGSREILVELVYKNGDKVIENKTISLSRHYTRKRAKPTIAHLAKKQTKDTSIPADGKRVLKISKVAGATSVEVTLSYRLVNDEVRSLLKLQEPRWSQKSFIAKDEIRY